MNAIEHQIAAVVPEIFGDPPQLITSNKFDGDSILEGQRNAVLASLAGSMRRKGFSTESIAAALTVENQRRCKPALSPSEVEEIAQSIGRYAPDAVAARMRFQVLDDVALLSRPTPPQLADGRIPARSLGVLIGATETWKSFLTIGVMGAIHHSGQWLSTPVRRGKALQVVGEGASGLKDRISAWQVAHGLTPETPLGMTFIEEPVNLFDPADVDRFIEEVIAPRAPLDLVTFDTLARCSVGMEENSARDMGIVIRSADRVRQAAQGVVLLNHHVNAAETKERGSSALRGAADFILRTSKTDDFVTLSCDKQKDMEPFEPLKLKLVPVPETNSCVVRLAADVLPHGGLSPAQRSAIEALWETFGTDGATSAEWETALPGMPRRTFYRAKKVLVELNYIEARGAKLVPRRRP
jgi:AAA domain/Primase C terminal 1 (PriCT-1)